MIFSVLFLILISIPALCIVKAVKDKAHNIGFIILSVFVAICDLLCFWLILCKTEPEAGHTLLLYHLCLAWFYFGFMLMVMTIARWKNYVIYCIPSAIIALLQSLIIINISNNSMLPVTRRHIFSAEWWVVKISDLFINMPSFYSVQMYRILFMVSSFIILFAMIICCNNSTNTFKNRFYVLIGIHCIITINELIMWKYSFPVWIMSLIINAFCLVGLYYTCYYSDRKLRNSSLKRFANEMSDGFLLYNEHGDLIEVNDLLKYAFPPLIIKSFEFKENLDEWISDTITVNNIEVIKYELDGKDTYYKAKKTDIMDYDKYLGTIYILHDTTESILKMRAMEQAKIELEKAAKMKADFLANMSHEIRTPMNAVIGMAEIALRDEKDPGIKDYLMQIQNSGKNLLNIINDILDFSKIEAGKMEIIPERYEPVIEITEMANVLATRIGDKDVELFIVVDNKLPHALEGDVMRIRQILINLANNAIKFTQKGFVSIVISIEKLSENTVNVIIHVIDTGQGIKNEDLDKLFVSFQQVDSKRNRSVEGTGLGLAISQRLCEAMHGKIGVTSEYGKGSDFYFSLPQKIIDPSLDIVVEEAEKKHATVVDDYPEMLDKFIDEINKLGVDVKAVDRLSLFEKSDGIDFVFFKEKSFDAEFESFLKDNPEVIGVIIVDFDSAFKTSIPNLRIMRKPETSINMVKILNGKDFAHEDKNAAFKIDFTAPDAKILIVDDNAINITIAEGLIKPVKAQCYGADSGKKAIAMIMENDFDLIFMDHMMPEMDGVETTRYIRDNIAKCADTPIIALSANVLEGVREMFLSEGMNDFVAKPIDIKNLVAKLKQWLPKEKIVDIDPQEIDDSEDTKDNDTIIFKELDNAKAIEALGSAELFKTIVKEYYRSGADKLSEIKAAYDNEDWPDYSIKVHALKSSSRQIGAFELGDMAWELEKAGKDVELDTIHAQTDVTLNKYKELLDKLSVYFEDETIDASELSMIEEDELKAILEKLNQACDDLDMDAMEECRDELKKYSYADDIKSMIEGICKAIADIDVETCEGLITEVLAKL